MTAEPTPPSQGAGVLDELDWRGLLADSTDREGLARAMDAGPVRFYVGFDPTAPSLHIGNLVQLMTARRLQLAGHRPYLLVGGATGMIGDPRDSGERTLNDAATVTDWVERLRRQIEPFLDFEGSAAATMVNNLDWTGGLGVLEFLRDVGKHFPVNRMLARDTVRKRLEDGISYTEFSYVLLQSMDYLHLFRTHGVALQFGATDQWGNITAGAELVRRVTGEHVHGFVTPLVTKNDGTKYGKSEGGAIWLDRDLMSPYAFHQFWLNVEDEQVLTLLRIFTLLPREEIDELAARHAEAPFRREAHRALADAVTTLVHGADETAQATRAAAALFGGDGLATLSPATLAAALAGAGVTEVDADALPAPVEDLLLRTGLVASRSEARRTVAEGGAYLNNERIEDAARGVTTADLLAGEWLVLRRGKKRFAGVRVG